MKIRPLRPLHLMGPVLCLLPLGLAAIQDSKTTQDPAKKKEVSSDRDFYKTQGNAAKDRALTKKLQGCWKLTGVEAEDFPERGRHLLGYMLVSGPFLSLKLQAYWDEANLEDPENAYESFVGELKPVGRNSMEVKVMMGSTLNRDEGNLQWYKSDKPERFAVSMPTTNTLTLTWKDKRKMTFRRQSPRNNADRDFYGKKKGSDFYDRADKPVKGEDSSKGGRR